MNNNNYFTQWSKILQIRIGLLKGIDVGPYLNPSIDYKEMLRIRLELGSNK